LARKSQSSYSNKLLLDTSYLLPFVGIEVLGVKEEICSEILKRELYYPSSLIPELSGVIIKEAKKNGLDEVPEEVINAFNTIVFGKDVHIILSEGIDLKIAYELIKLGWRDLFDALLYATAMRIEMQVLSLDKQFKGFLKDHGYNYELFVSHKELF